MAYLALYRRYRPTTFDKLIGQDSIVKTLTNQIETGRLGHAYLFTGTRGTGKTSCAKIFSKAINCLNPINGSPCGECECCKALSDPSNIDVIEIDAASNNGVNEIRDLREKVQYPPVSCKYKVYIIDEVHMLSGAAFNALLKTLEEPPKHAVFILATTEVQKIPATILSRCMRFDFKLIPTDKIAALIEEIYDEAGKKYESEAVNLIAQAGEGSIRDALSIADIALSYGSGTLTYNDVTDILGSTNFELLTSFVDAVISSDDGKVMDIIEKLSMLGKSMGVLLKDVTVLLRNVLIASLCDDAASILSLPSDKFVTIKTIADKTNKDRILRALDIFTDAENMLKYSNRPRIIFEKAAIKAARPDSDYNIDALLGRIKTLEDKISSLSLSKQSEPCANMNNGAATDLKIGGIEKNIEKTDEEQLKSEKYAEKVNSCEKQNSPRADENIDEKKGDDLTDSGNYNNAVASWRGNVGKKAIADDKENVSGILLSNLRKNNHEMLWNLLQSVNIQVSGNVLVLSTEVMADAAILDRNDNKEYIKEALSEFLPFEIQVKLSEERKKINRFDEETDKIKKLFGEDIVIIKDE